MYALLCMGPGALPLPPLTTDFGEYVVNTELSSQGWTYSASAFSVISRSVAGGISDKQAVVAKTGSNGARVATLNVVGTITDVEILAHMRILDAPSGSGETIAQLISRYADSTHYYVALPRNITGGTTKVFEIGKEAGSGGVVIGNTPFSWNATDPFWVRFRIVGTALKAKIWLYGSDEPSAWTVENTDASNASGKVGLAAFFTAYSYRCGFFSVALGGATAPSPSG